MTNSKTIHQFTPTLSPADGISQAVLYIQKLLLELGFKSEIYIADTKIDYTFKHKIHHITQYNQSPDQTLLYHHAIGHSYHDQILRFCDKKILIYHNITPSHFFKDSPLLKSLCDQGRRQLQDAAHHFIGAIADSAYNAKELKAYGYKAVKELTLLLDSDQIKTTKPDPKLLQKYEDSYNILFVGRIVSNKAQHQLIETLFFLKEMGATNTKLFLVGAIAQEEYFTYIQNLIKRLSLTQEVIITKGVNESELASYYHLANLYLSLSNHEGFGIPLVEAMCYNIPVLAYDIGGISSALPKESLLKVKAPSSVAKAILRLQNDPQKRAKIIKKQKEHRKKFTHHNNIQNLYSYLTSLQLKPPKKPLPQKPKQLQKPCYRFEGPFDSSYSLAIVNRYAALAFEKKYPNQVALLSTEGGGDFAPDEAFLAKNPKIAHMHTLAQKGTRCDVVLRNLYPPRTTNMQGEINILNAYGWEESAFAKKYVDEFNQNLDGITTMSSYVKKVLQNNGVKLPISVVGLGVDHLKNIQPKPLQLQTKKSFKFLHISSCFPRKGVDTLLKAYTQAFSKDDDVTLIIKTFPNPHNTIKEQLSTRKKEHPNAPEILLIDQDLDDGTIVWLYKNCDTLVAPSRGEGFGLPIAEAMLFQLPVITTGFGGQLDFCTNETASLIDFHFQKAKTHFKLFNSYQANPDENHLTQLLKQHYKQRDEQKVQKAYNHITQEFTWEHYRTKTEAFLQQLHNQTSFDEAKKEIALISSLNTKCGIASYSESLIEHINQEQFTIHKFANYTDEILDTQKEQTITRCWGDRFDSDNNLLINKVCNSPAKYILINFNFGFFSMQNLKTMIEQFKKNALYVSIIFHSVADVTIQGLEASLSTITPALKKADNLLVHTINDLNFFKNLGLTNMELLPHGLHKRTQKNTQTKKNKHFTIASYGFLLPHKGILELIEAFSMLNDKTLKLTLINALYPAPVSQTYAKRCQEKIKELHLTKQVQLYTDFLSHEEIFLHLSQADLIVMPYQKTNESSSASAREALATYKPLLCTPQPIFSDIEDIVHFSSGYTPKELSYAIATLKKDEALLHKNSNRQKEWINEHDWKNIASRVENIFTS